MFKCLKPLLIARSWDDISRAYNVATNIGLNNKIENHVTQGTPFKIEVSFVYKKTARESPIQGLSIELSGNTSPEGDITISQRLWYPMPASAIEETVMAMFEMAADIASTSSDKE